MAIRLEKEFLINLPQQDVWNAIQSPEIIAEILPNCKSLESISKNQYTANIEIKIGPVTGKYKSNLSLFDLDPPSGYRFKVSGIGVKGTMSGEGEIKLVESDEGTKFIFIAEGNVSGIIVRVGQRFIEAAGKKLMDQGFNNLKEKIAVPV